MDTALSAAETYMIWIGIGLPVLCCVVGLVCVGWADTAVGRSDARVGTIIAIVVGALAGFGLITLAYNFHGTRLRDRRDIAEIQQIYSIVVTDYNSETGLGGWVQFKTQGVDCDANTTTDGPRRVRILLETVSCDAKAPAKPESALAEVVKATKADHPTIAVNAPLPSDGRGH